MTINMTKADLRGVSWAGKDLEGAILLGANLSGALLQGASLRRAKLRCARIRDASLSLADLGSADLELADLRESNLSNARLACCNLCWAKLRDANLMGADLRQADLYEADLRYAAMSGASLQGARLVGADLRGTDLSGVAGLLDPGEWIRENLECRADGLVVYRWFGTTERAPPTRWRIEPGSTITETVNPCPTHLCGCGINCATLGWCVENILNYSGQIWRCLIEWPDVATLVVPYGTDGRVRVGRLRLLGPLDNS